MYSIQQERWPSTQPGLKVKWACFQSPN